MATRTNARRWVVVAAGALVLLVAVVALMESTRDRYGVGTTHEVVLDPGPDHTECGPRWHVRLDDGSNWIPSQEVVGDPTTPIPGTFSVIADGRGELESADLGSRTVAMMRGSFALSCTPPG